MIRGGIGKMTNDDRKLANGKKYAQGSLEDVAGRGDLSVGVISNPYSVQGAVAQKSKARYFPPLIIL